MSFFQKSAFAFAFCMLSLSYSKAPINQNPLLEIKESSPFSKIAQEFMKSYAESRPETTQAQKKLLKLPEISTHALYKNIYALYSTVPTTPSTVLHKNGYGDLELLCGEHKQSSNLVNFLDNTTTSFGKLYLSYLLTTPLTDIKTLQARQAVIQEFTANESAALTIKSALEQIKSAENTFFFLWQQESEFNSKAINRFYFSTLTAINSNPYLMQALCLKTHLVSVGVGLAIPLFNFTTQKLSAKFIGTGATNKDHLRAVVRGHIPWTIELQEGTVPGTFISQKITPGKNLDLHSRLSELSPSTSLSWGDQYVLNKALGNMYKNAFCVTSLIGVAAEAATMYRAYSREKENNELTNYLQTQMIAAGTVIRGLQTINKEIQSNPLLAAGLEHKHHLAALFDATDASVSAKLKQLTQLLLTNTFTKEASYFSFKGRVLAAYALMKNIKDEFAPALLALGEVDAYLSCATLYKNSAQQKNGYCFATYLEQDTPYLNAQGMWNPFVGAEKSVVNSIELGSNLSQNVILTGPNAGGKSTFSKGITLTTILAQTIGIVPARSFVCTPFAKINTYMNISDDTAGGNSLFKSEVMRAQELLNSIIALPKNQFSFSVMDEMFSGTSPKEGEAAGYAVAKNIGSHKNSIAIIATHFPRLKQLDTDTGNFKNYQVRVVRHNNGTFSYPFKLEEGAADQNVALDILANEGFESSILTDAHAIMNESATLNQVTAAA